MPSQQYQKIIHCHNKGYSDSSRDGALSSKMQRLQGSGLPLKGLGSQPEPNRQIHRDNIRLIVGQNRPSSKHRMFQQGNFHLVLQFCSCNCLTKRLPQNNPITMGALYLGYQATRALDLRRLQHETGDPPLRPMSAQSMPVDTLGALFDFAMLPRLPTRIRTPTGQT